MVSMNTLPTDAQAPLIGCLVVIGVGLIGGSLAKNLKASNLVKHIVGVGRNEQSLKRAIELNVIDAYNLDMADAVKQADLVVISTPVLSTLAVLKKIKDTLPGHAVVTDVGSAKAIVVDAIETVFGYVPTNFVLGHPIAGSERSGVDAAQLDLFKKHNVILTPLSDTDARALEMVRTLWKSTGANVLNMTVDYHDQVLAATSHLPHLIAYSLVDTLAKQGSNLDIFRYAAGGFRDFTRIAASDPVMWHDIFIANRESVLASLESFSVGLNELKTALETNDSQTMLGIFTRAKAARDHFTKILARRAYLEPMNKNNVVFSARQGRALTGSLRVPGDKSISHRSIMLGAIAEGNTDVSGFLEGEDSLATLQAFRDMGVVIEGPEQGRVKIYGVGLRGLSKPPGPLYLGNSGTSMRLLSGLLSAQSFDVELTGDKSLSGRPMGRVIDPLSSMGARIESNQGKPPLKISGNRAFKGITYKMPVASAQVKSSLLLAGLYAEGETCVIEPAPTRDHTERMLGGFGYPVKVRQIDDNCREVCINGGGPLTGTKIDVPADISSAAFFLVAASITPGSDLLLEHVGVNPTRTGIINILLKMGAKIELLNERIIGGEPVADLRVQYAPLKGIAIPEDQVPLAIDEFPVLFVAAACAKGQTILTGAEELRVKESDRIQAMADGLIALGVDAQPTVDGMIINGSKMAGAQINSHGDHRIAMAFAVAALRAEGPIDILDCANVSTSFPNFVQLANGVGMNISIQGQQC